MIEYHRFTVNAHRIIYKPKNYIVIDSYKKAISISEYKTIVSSLNFLMLEHEVNGNATNPSIRRVK